MSDETVVDPEVTVTVEDATPVAPKTFSVVADLWYLDSDNMIERVFDYTDCNLVAENPVAVKDESGKVIGSAVVSVEDKLGTGRTVTADITIDYQTPERLTIEAGSSQLFPLFDSYNDVEITAHYKKAINLHVQSITIGSFAPRDNRVPALKVS